MTYRNVSLSDLIQFKEYDGSIESRNKLLYKLGCDITQEIEVLNCQHRSLAGHVVTCEYYLCAERRDKNWVNSPYSSLEVVLSSSDDPSKRRLLREMSVQGFQGALNEGGE